MAELSALNSGSSVNDEENSKRNDFIKQEVEVPVKREPVDCLVCADRSADGFEIHSTKTVVSNVTLYEFLCNLSQATLTSCENYSKYVCKTCYDLVNELERAEKEYKKLKDTFEAIINKNPLFDCRTSSSNLCTVKNEVFESVYDDLCKTDNDSEDEPLALTKHKRQRKVDKRKKKSSAEVKRRKRHKVNKDSWECNICGLVSPSGGTDAFQAHMLTSHGTEDAEIKDVKKEDILDDFQNSNDTLESILKIKKNEFLDDDDDDSGNYEPETLSNGKHRRNKLQSSTGPKRRKKREEKVLHPCDRCDAKYTSLLRLEQHKLKHEDSKPPYICEVCGAHYKHKRACDIHVALHKGISDWKCEECNKLFPSKGALQRHNNIHTGKLNYQCDLCGKSFIHTSSFKMHKLSHSGVKSHACDVCGLALMTRSHLKRHKRIHSGEKRHECSVCGKRFSERYNLVAHSKSHDSAAGCPPPAAPRTRIFRCNFCHERFDRKYMLERHCTMAHGRALERPPPTPRNTMSKLLKAQAAARRSHEPDSKEEQSPESRASPPVAQKLLAQLTSAGSVSASVSAWGTQFAPRAFH
ncbi:zinc finger protein 729 [Papilio machaon]|uniref:zinc finger protein 729 n=1 Tax=Papilio machaon TaxID=76193 RepID=UPI0006EB05F9|nr:zinc finger protein 729 [Papilio machaon]